MTTQVPNGVLAFDGGALSGFRNRIINGDMRVWQRGTTGTVTNNYGAGNAGGYLSADRWYAQCYAGVGGGGTCTVITSQNVFTAGQTAVPGEPQYSLHGYASPGTLGSSSAVIQVSQPIENVTTFAGQTATVSFYAKADAARTFAVLLQQNFGTGGSPSALVAVGQTIAVTTAWQKFSITLAVPSISGKTLGTNNDHQLRLIFALYKQDNLTFGDSLGPVGSWVTQAIDIVYAQVELGSVATPFETRPIGTELALCQRYYYQLSGTGTGTIVCGGGMANGTSQIRFSVKNPVTMRLNPGLTFAGNGYFNIQMGATASGISASGPINTSPDWSSFYFANVTAAPSNACTAVMQDLLGYTGAMVAVSAEL